MSGPTRDPGPTISVALCTYNGASFIEEQVTSILGQTLPPTEIVVSDDASADATLETIERVVAAWSDGGHPTPVVRVLRNSAPLGVTANFAQAIAACTGQLIALSDQDDVWHPRKLERIVAAFSEREDVLLVHSDARMVDAHGLPTGAALLATLAVTDGERQEIREGRAIDALLRRNLVTGATAAFRRSLVEAAEPIPGEWVHDEWLAVVAAATGGVRLIEEPLIDYRQHGGNQIGAQSLGLGGNLGRLREPRSARNARLLARARVLAERVPSIPGVPRDVQDRAHDKLVHEVVRSGYPASRIRRVVPVLRELRTGRYSRFGLGARDVARDIVQPV